jgi:hypothetical protein
MSLFGIVLKLYETYSREDVHSIFAPDTRFVPQAGTWGLQGIISIPNRPHDFVFFVTLGQQQGDHRFDEGITEDGVLSWQSQPKQRLDDRQIQQFIHHDELKSSIYLFFRVRERNPYTYLGTLKYVSHDHERENPVYFQWQLIEGPIPADVQKRMALNINPRFLEEEPFVKNTLQETSPPRIQSRQGISTKTFQSRKTPDYSVRDAKNRTLGLQGEALVVLHEKHALIAAGRPDLAEQVCHISVQQGDRAGYDVLSFTEDGHEKFIEVKTTTGPAETEFFMTSHEVEASRQYAEKYYLYRVYRYNESVNSGYFYVQQGRVDKLFTLTPSQYRVRYEAIKD